MKLLKEFYSFKQEVREREDFKVVIKGFPTIGKLGIMAFWGMRRKILIWSKKTSNTYRRLCSKLKRAPPL